MVVVPGGRARGKMLHPARLVQRGPPKHVEVAEDALVAWAQNSLFPGSAGPMSTAGEADDIPMKIGGF